MEVYNMLAKAYYRSFQAVFNGGSRLMPWHKPNIISGPGSIRKIPELLLQENVK